MSGAQCFKEGVPCELHPIAGAIWQETMCTNHTGANGELIDANDVAQTTDTQSGRTEKLQYIIDNYDVMSAADGMLPELLDLNDEDARTINEWIEERRALHRREGTQSLFEMAMDQTEAESMGYDSYDAWMSHQMKGMVAAEEKKNSNNWTQVLELRIKDERYLGVSKDLMKTRRGVVVQAPPDDALTRRDDDVVGKMDSLH